MSAEVQIGIPWFGAIDLPTSVGDFFNNPDAPTIIWNDHIVDGQVLPFSESVKRLGERISSRVQKNIVAHCAWCRLVMHVITKNPHLLGWIDFIFFINPPPSMSFFETPLRKSGTRLLWWANWKLNPGIIHPHYLNSLRADTIWVNRQFLDALGWSTTNVKIYVDKGDPTFSRIDPDWYKNMTGLLTKNPGDRHTIIHHSNGHFFEKCNTETGF